MPVLLGLLALAAGFAWFLAAAAAIPGDPEARTDGIAVLTGGAERVETGLRLLAAGRARLLLVSGAHPDATLGDLARRAGLDPAALTGRVTLGRAALGTRGNAEEIAAWARAHRLLSLRIVTAGYHMPRALLELRRALPEVALVPNPVQPAALRDAAVAGRLRTWSLLAGEYLKLIGAYAGLAPRAIAEVHG
ncbi:MAG TPA: YdcF family protein [Crenalkalicoccus sp.]|nr:YdcF family protein [Crenalkalicoccus sp.]